MRGAWVISVGFRIVEACVLWEWSRRSVRCEVCNVRPECGVITVYAVMFLRCSEEISLWS